MLFNSYVFIFLFLPVCLAGFYVLSRRGGQGWIVWVNLCSVFFYGYWSLNHLVVFLCSIVFNHAVCRPVSQKSKPALIAGITFNLGLLCYFKYTNFMIDQVNAVLGGDIEWIGVVLPIGISFFTFQQIAYLVDAYKGRAEPVSFMRYFFFVSFFPQLIAGPIVHHSEIFFQLDRYKPHIRNLAIGISVFCVGLFKKVVLADTVAVYASSIFGYAEAGGDVTLIEAWFGAIAYALQIYFDFSAYSDMAIGLGRMFGLRLPQNFASPYKAVSIVDFWRRWHITLSRFLRDYLYIPLGGNRKGEVRRYVNVIVTMLIGGLWHGASWSFVLWGGLHGLFLMTNQFFSRAFSKKIPKPAGWIVTMTCVVFAWVPFRATNMEGIVNMWKGMLCLNGVKVPDRLGFTGLETGALLSVVNLENGLLLVGLIGLCVLAPNASEIFIRYRVTLPTADYPATMHRRPWLFWRPTLSWAVVLMLMFMLAALKLNDPSEFLYFQF